MKPEPSAEADDEARVHGRVAAGLDPIAPPPAMHSALQRRLLERAAHSAATHAGLITRRSRDGEWQTVKPGVAMKLLHLGTQGNSVLIRLDAGAALPVHRHRFVEEGIVLSGDLNVGSDTLGVGDYHLSPLGSRHDRIVSRNGGMAFLRGTSLGERSGIVKELLSGMLPHRGAPSVTVHAAAAAWKTIAPGVTELRLHDADGMISRFIRMAPNSEVSINGNADNEECMLIEGEAFCGDILLQAGDYQVAPAGHPPLRLHSDCGGLLFLRGATALATTE